MDYLLHHCLSHLAYSFISSKYIENMFFFIYQLSLVNAVSCACLYVLIKYMKHWWFIMFKINWMFRIIWNIWTLSWLCKIERRLMKYLKPNFTKLVDIQEWRYIVRREPKSICKPVYLLCKQSNIIVLLNWTFNFLVNF